jgi:hypothetical protein
MTDDLGIELDEEPAQPIARVPLSTGAGARWPGEVIKQRRTFRIGLQFAPVAIGLASPAVLATILNPDLLHVRSLQFVALAAFIVAAVGIYLLCHRLSRRSHRLHSIKFWLSIAANAIVIVALTGAAVRAYRWGHAPAEVHRAEADE